MNNLNQEEREKVVDRIGEIMSRLLSRKYDAKVTIKFKAKSDAEFETEKKNKK